VVLKVSKEAVERRKEEITYRMTSKRGIAARRAMLRAVYSASMVEVGMLVCSLDIHWIGQPMTSIRKPVRHLTQTGSLGSS
jgi:hypothetical protein